MAGGGKWTRKQIYDKINHEKKQPLDSGDCFLLGAEEMYKDIKAKLAEKRINLDKMLEGDMVVSYEYEKKLCGQKGFYYEENTDKLMTVCVEIDE